MDYVLSKSRRIKLLVDQLYCKILACVRFVKNFKDTLEDFWTANERVNSRQNVHDLRIRKFYTSSYSYRY